jgi:hypothetical protein
MVTKPKRNIATMTPTAWGPRMPSRCKFSISASVVIVRIAGALDSLESELVAKLEWDQHTKRLKKYSRCQRGIVTVL